MDNPLLYIFIKLYYGMEWKSYLQIIEMYEKGFNVQSKADVNSRKVQDMI